jgi:hypothetical protein
MMFDLADDEGEVENIAAKNPGEHETLFREMMGYFERVGARIPKVNPDYDSESYKKAKEYEQRMAWGPFERRRSLEADEQLNQ